MACVLIVDDNETLREGARAILKKMGHRTIVCKSGEEGICDFNAQVDMVLTDLKMEGQDGLDVLREVSIEDPDAVVMLMTGFGSVKTAVEAMKQGAYDFIEKPFSPDVLRAKVTGGLALREERRAMEKAKGLHTAHAEDAARPYAVATINDDKRGSVGIIGKSEAIQSVMRIVEKVARTDTTVFVRGESGTGKELIARAIHNLSPRKNNAFVSVNCAAIPSTLLESELFGHERGAFTGAVKRKLGRFELADGGTLFLDEIGDVPLEMQAKLLRALQEKEIQRVGGEEVVSLDVRVISATHRDIKAMVQEGAFREDLLYRLHIIPVEIPPLRDRPEDIALLVEHFIEKLGPSINSQVRGVDKGALDALKAYRWPGNVRELENVVEQALVFAETETLSSDDLPAMLGSLKPSTVKASEEGLPNLDDPRSLDEVLEGLEKALILRAYEASNRTKTATARKLGIKTSALYYKLAKYNIDGAKI
ncbi:MAG: sigma-54-dependent Fis family transcriptional regulator [Deltaproteobacteria bacterium]|nr:sigma-54-dependent Fis family transcriptional regulator [Deltaproteobacteria bacterium]